MKKEYKDLELETVNFGAEDVITASGEEPPPCSPNCMCITHSCRCIRDFPDF